ncbi:hypothetical protein Bca4012_100458 [Brassica carinata]
MKPLVIWSDFDGDGGGDGESKGGNENSGNGGEGERGDVGEDEADKSEDKEFGRYYCETGRSMTAAYLCSR